MYDGWGAHHSFSNVYTGSYEVVAYHGPKYGGGEYGSKKGCSVSGGATVTVDFPLTHLQPAVAVDVLEPGGTVGNSVPIKFKLTYHPGAYELLHLWLWSYDATGQYRVMILDTTSLYWLSGAVWEYNEDYSTASVTITYPWWDTAGYGYGGSYYNGTVTLKAAAEFTDPWATDGAPYKKGLPPANAQDAGTAGGGTVAPNVQNLILSGATTSSGNPDYFFMRSGAAEQPWVKFTIADAGRTADDNGNPYHYNYTVYLRDTRSMDWENSTYWYMNGSRTGTGDVTVNIPTSGWGSWWNEEAPLPDRGTYTFDV